mmetsp:Transcript_17106/g.57613  ORF Transcript_17106/g.57613 Transcript_17106/m.57613 type:complete len:201 (+) Transcript_17106:242-844(+)
MVQFPAPRYIVLQASNMLWVRPGMEMHRVTSACVARGASRAQAPLRRRQPPCPPPRRSTTPSTGSWSSLAPARCTTTREASTRSGPSSPMPAAGRTSSPAWCRTAPAGSGCRRGHGRRAARRLRPRRSQAALTRRWAPLSTSTRSSSRPAVRKRPFCRPLPPTRAASRRTASRLSSAGARSGGRSLSTRRSASPSRGMRR